MRFQNVSNELNVGYKQRDRKKEIYFLFFILRSSVLFLLEDHYWITANESEKKKMEKYDRISNMKSSSCTCVVRCDEDLTTFHLMFFSFVFFSLGPFFFSYFTCSVLIWISTNLLFYSDFYGELVDGFLFIEQLLFWRNYNSNEQNSDDKDLRGITKRIIIMMNSEKRFD